MGAGLNGLGMSLVMVPHIGTPCQHPVIFQFKKAVERFRAYGLGSQNPKLYALGLSMWSQFYLYAPKMKVDYVREADQ